MSAKTGVLFLNPDPRKDAGCNISLLSLIGGLDARFIPIVATPADSPFAERLRERKIEIIDYRMNNWWYPDEAHFFRSAAGFKERVRQLAELIRERRLALVHTNAEYAFEGALAAAQTGIPHIWNIRQTFGADLPILRHFPLSPQALGEFMAGFSERIVPNAQPLIATFPANIPPQKFSVIPSGIRVDAPANKVVARAALRKRLGLPQDCRVILTMGRISPEKDLVTFIETARKLVREHQRNNLRFVHFGSAYNAVYFEQLKGSLGDLSGSLIFAGPVNTPLDVIRGADILLFTSTAFEGLARVCLEALLMEVPVVATRCLGPEEYLLHGETALLASPGDADTLAAHVATLLDDPGCGNALAQNGNALVKAKYDEKRVCAQWMSLYDELALATSPRPLLSAAAEPAINLLSLCGQLGERIVQQERRLRNLERIARIVETPFRLCKRMIKTFIPLRGGQNSCPARSTSSSRSFGQCEGLPASSNPPHGTRSWVKMGEGLMNLSEQINPCFEGRGFPEGLANPDPDRMRCLRTPPTGAQFRRPRPDSAGCPAHWTMPPTVSIIMPCHNAVAHLPASVGSVLAQTFTDWELIAIDDGSRDGTLTWLRAQTDTRIRPLAQANRGVSEARNAGLTEARGTYVAFLDADDTWTPAFLEKMLAALLRRPDAVLAYCGWQNLGLPGGRGNPFVPPDYENAAKSETLFADCRWPIHAALVKREAVLATDGFDPMLKNAEDYALWLRVATSGPIVLVPEVLAFYHFHGGTQASSNAARAALHHLQAQQRYLAEHPDFCAALGKKRVRTLTLGGLLKRGYVCYWQRDLPAAREIFRAAMQRGYGTVSDWKYILPAWLPESWHRWLINLRESGRNATNEHR